GGAVRVTISDVHVFGFLARPTPLLAHDILAALGRAAADEAAEAAPNGVALDHLDLHPLDSLLWRVLPPAGRRLPAPGPPPVAGPAVGRGRVEVRFGPDKTPTPKARRAPTAGALDLLRPGDARLAAGDLDGAIAHYRAELARAGAEAPLAAERL